MADERDDDDVRRLASRRVAGQLRAAIDSDEYLPGTALPSLRQLAAEHDVAVNTAMAAMRLLVDDGYVTNRPNSGYYVRDRAEAGPEFELRALRDGLDVLRQMVRNTSQQLTEIDARLDALSKAAALIEHWARQHGA